jgi:mono/diheme cytochrome c family protein
MGQDPITYYRKNPWVMKSIGTPEALMPGSHYADGRYKNANGGFNCSCHSSDAMVHNGAFTDTAAKWQLDLLPKPIDAVDPGPGPGPDGPALYAANCAACHGPIASSTLKARAGLSVAMVKAAIAGTGTNAMANAMMSALRGVLTDEQIAAIVAVLQ